MLDLTIVFLTIADFVILFNDLFATLAFACYNNIKKYVTNET